MIFDRKIGGMDIVLRIDGYESPEEHQFGARWCDCGFSFSFGNIINYYKQHDEILMPEEVDYLARALTDLLEDKIDAPDEIKLVEPDFVFMLYPKEDLRNNPKYAYIAPGHEIQDIYAEWRIFFWDGGLTDNFLTITLDRGDITALRDFFLSCKTGKKQQS